MPLVHVTMLEGRDKASKRKLLHAVSLAVQETLDVPETAVRVWVTDVPRDEYMSGFRLASE